MSNEVDKLGSMNVQYKNTFELYAKSDSVINNTVYIRSDDVVINFRPLHLVKKLLNEQYNFKKKYYTTRQLPRRYVYTFLVDVDYLNYGVSEDKGEDNGSE
jgi:hypothetical protein